VGDFFGALPMRGGCICCEVQQGQPEIFATRLAQCTRTVFTSNNSVRKRGCRDKATLAIQLRFPMSQHELLRLTFCGLTFWPRVSEKKHKVPASYVLGEACGEGSPCSSSQPVLLALIDVP